MQKAMVQTQCGITGSFRDISVGSWVLDPISRDVAMVTTNDKIIVFCRAVTALIQLYKSTPMAVV